MFDVFGIVIQPRCLSTVDAHFHGQTSVVVVVASGPPLLFIPTASNGSSPPSMTTSCYCTTRVRVACLEV